MTATCHLARPGAHRARRYKRYNGRQDAPRAPALATPTSRYQGFFVATFHCFATGAGRRGRPPQPPVASPWTPGVCPAWSKAQNPANPHARPASPPATVCPNKWAKPSARAKRCLGDSGRSGRPGRQRLKANRNRAGAAGNRLSALLMTIPNLPHESVPAGRDKSDNVESAGWASRAR